MLNPWDIFSQRLKYSFKSKIYIFRKTFYSTRESLPRKKSILRYILHHCIFSLCALTFNSLDSVIKQSVRSTKTVAMNKMATKTATAWIFAMGLCGCFLQNSALLGSPFKWRDNVGLLGRSCLHSFLYTCRKWFIYAPLSSNSSWRCRLINFLQDKLHFS